MLRRENVSSARGRARLSIITCCTVALLAALTTLATAPAWRPPARAMLVLPDLLLFQPARPSLLVTMAPARETVRFQSGSQTLSADLYSPRPAGSGPGMVVLLGVYPAQLDDARVQRLGDGLARQGFTVMIPRSERLAEGHLDPAEVDDIAAAHRYLSVHPKVAGRPVGVLGFSVGGGLALLAAANPAIRDQVAFVISVGGYGDAQALLTAIGSGEAGADARTWGPSDFAKYAYRRAVIDLADGDADRKLLEGGFLAADPVSVRASDLVPGNAQILQLLEASEPAEVKRVLAGLSPARQARLRLLSPLYVADGIHAPMFLMHDRNDTYVPVEETRDLEKALGGRATTQEYRMFAHVEPETPRDVAEFFNGVSGLITQLELVFRLVE